MFGLTPFSRKNNGLQKAENVWDIRNVFDDFFNDSFLPGFFTGTNSMKADIRDTGKEYIVEAEIPGVNKEDIKLEFRDNTLAIRVEHNEQVDEERENYIRKERRYGSYGRSFYVENVKQEDITAKYENGILVISLPKTEGVKENNHRIDIQ